MAVHEGHIVGEILVAIKTGAGNPSTHGIVATQVYRCGIGFPRSEVRPDSLGKYWGIAAAHL